MNKQNEKYLKEFRELFRKWGDSPKEELLMILEQFLSKALDSIREETLRDVEKEFEKSDGDFDFVMFSLKTKGGSNGD